MSQETKEQPTNQSDIAVASPSQGDVVAAAPTTEMPCPTCAGMASIPVDYVYAIGRIEARFPRLSVEKEFAQATGRAETAGQTDQQVFYNVLSKPENRYLARQMCWVLMIQGWETYLLKPRDPRDFDRLVEAIRKIVEAIFAYTNRNTDYTEKFCVRCDVTEEFPFLVTKLSPYYDR